MAALLSGLVTIATPRLVSGAPQTRLAVLRASDVSKAGGASAPFAFSHIGVRWKGSLDARVEVRWQSDDVRHGVWSPWTPVEGEDDDSRPAQGLIASSLLLAPGASRAQVRLVSGDARDIEVVAIDAERGNRMRIASNARVAAASTPLEQARVPAPPIISRSEWGADESLRSGTPEFAPLSKFVVHHTDTPNGDPDPAATVRAIYAYHTQSNGWNDIGYNFLIDEAGHIYEGRYSRSYGPGEIHTGEDASGLGVIGAHALGHNYGSVGIALLGNFIDATPTQEAIHSLNQLIAWKADRHGIDPQGSGPFPNPDGTPGANSANVVGHSDVGSTSCPGGRLHDMLPAIRTSASSIIAAARGTTRGYWVAAHDGNVLNFGVASSYGSLAGAHLNQPIVAMTATPSGSGYWLLGADGGIFAFGDAPFLGSTGGIRLNKPVVNMASTPSGHGYWLVASDGGIFAYGDASFYGSTGGIVLNKPVVSMASTPSGRGYWLAASDGGIFAYGDAPFYGSTGSLRLNSPVVAMRAASKAGGGYWLVAGDGGVFAFNVAFWGSVPGLKLPSYAGTTAMEPTATDNGYYILGADGGIFTFGDAKFLGANSGLTGSSKAADLALLPNQ